MRIRLRSLVLVVACLACGGIAHAQEDKLAPYLGRPVAAVTFDIEGRRDTSPQLPNLVDVKVGQPLRREDLRTSISRLVGAGGFKDALALINETTAGLEVIFRLLPRHPINKLEFRVVGESTLQPGDLESRFRAEYGALPTETRIGVAEDTMNRLLHEEGYLDSVVRTEIVPVHDPEGATLVFNVRPGTLFTVAQVTFQNTSTLPDAEVQKAAGVRAGQAWRERDAQNALATLQDDLRRRGFYEAIATVTAVRRPDNTGVDVTLVVNAGRSVDLRVVGELPGKREDLIPFEREGSIDDDVLDAARERIKSAFRRRGFHDGDAPYTREQRANGTLLITFTAQPGPRYRISTLGVPDDLAIPQREVERLLQLKVGQVYSESAVMAGLQRVLIALAGLGYFEASGAPVTEYALPGAPGDDAHASVRFDITQGPRGVVKDITFTFSEGNGGRVPEAELRTAMASRPGEPFVTANLRQDVYGVEDAYKNKGFRSAVAAIKPSPSEDHTAITLNVSIVEGPQIFVGSLVIVGNRILREDTIRDQIPLRVGEPFGEAARRETQSILQRRGIFRRVQVEEEPRLAGETLATVVISVEELPSNTLGFGGGLEVASRVRTVDGETQGDTIDFAPRGFVDVGRRNIGGRNRQANLFARVSLKRRNIPDDPARDATGFEFSEYRVAGTFHERQAFSSNTDLVVGFTSEQGIRTTFSFVREAANVDVLRQLSPRVSLTGRYSLDFTRLFDERIPEDERPLIDRFFPQVRLSILSTGIIWDRRNDPLTPSRGTMSSADVEFALRAIGSEIGYAKMFVQTSAFRAISTTQQMVLAGRVQFGVARGFERLADLIDAEGEPVLNDDGTPVRGVVQDLPASQRFFTGGATSVRGFQLDRLGVPEIISPNGLSVGGNGMVVLNAELRKVIGKLYGRNFSAVGFVDAGNVFARASDLDLSRIRGALGLGARYDSPLGPIRLDFGFKMDRRVVGGRLERRWEYHLSIGEVF